MSISRLPRRTRRCACAVTFLLAACGGSDSPTQATKNPNQVGAAGGVVQTADQRVTLNVPAGAVNKDVVISVTPVPNPSSDDHVATNSIYQFGPEGTQFAQPVTLKLAYDSSALPAGTDPAALRISTFANGAWQVVDNITVDSASHTVSGQIHHFSIYGVNADPCTPRTGDLNFAWVGHITSTSCLYPIGPKYSDYFNTPAFTGVQAAIEMDVTSQDFTGGYGIKDYDASDPSKGTVWAYSPIGTGIRVNLRPGRYQLFVSTADTTKHGDYQGAISVHGSYFGAAPCDPTFVGLTPGTYNLTALTSVSCDITLQYSDPPKYNGQHTKADYYAVKLPGGHTYTFTATIETANTNIALALYGNGKFLNLAAGPSTQNPKVIRFTPATDMWVTLEVSASTISDTWNAPLGAYRIEVSN
ncbi:MAG TPA: hypothetical protein VFT41_11395 [Gemmatimonadaceae bacterium]|nr:hypothetical protein [Gemmatimonadaceae bacterium]